MIAKVEVEADGGIEPAHSSTAGVVGVVGGGEAVLGAEVEVVEAQRADDVESGAERQPKLAEEGGGPDAFLLIQREHAHLAPVVGEVAAIIALDLPLDAEVHPARARTRCKRPCQGEPDSAAVPVQVDHVCGDGVVQLAPDPVERKRPLQPAQGAPPAHPGLTLLHVLAGSPPDVEPPRLVASLVEEFRGKRSAVERVQVETAQLHREHAPGYRRGEPGVDGGARGLAVGILARVRRVVAEAVEPVSRDAGAIGNVPGGARPGRLRPEQPVRTGDDGGLLAVGSRVRPRALEEEDAARAVSVQGGGGAAQGLHSSQGADVEVVERRLPVGEGGRNAIDQNLDSTDAELGTGAEAADRNPFAHRRVVAVLHPHAGQAVQRLLDEQSCVALGEVGAGHDGSREREPVQAHRRSQHRHDDRCQLDRVLRLGLGHAPSRNEDGGQGAGQQQGGAEAEC